MPLHFYAFKMIQIIRILYNKTHSVALRADRSKLTGSGASFTTAFFLCHSIVIKDIYFNSEIFSWNLYLTHT